MTPENLGWRLGLQFGLAVFHSRISYLFVQRRDDRLDKSEAFVRSCGGKHAFDLVWLNLRLGKIEIPACHRLPRRAGRELDPRPAREMRRQRDIRCGPG